MFEEIASVTPTIHAPGNHEHYTDDDELLFRTSFKTYGVEEDRAVGIYLGNLFLIPFDPYYEVYKYEITKSAYDALVSVIKAGHSSGRFLLPFSHYCMTCSTEFGQCDGIFKQIRGFFDMMVDEGITLYLGAHTHAY